MWIFISTFAHKTLYRRFKETELTQWDSTANSIDILNCKLQFSIVFIVGFVFARSTMFSDIQADKRNEKLHWLQDRRCL
jgi:hypothetical protein